MHAVFPIKLLKFYICSRSLTMETAHDEGRKSTGEKPIKENYL